METLTIDDITYCDFWAIFLGSYICCLAENGGQFEGSIPSDLLGSSTEETANLFMQKYQQKNEEGFNIHFTPNGMLKAEDKNRQTNFAHINAWFVDIDIDDCKEIKTPEDLNRRQTKKDLILGSLINHKVPMPSLTVETRNGYQVYWFAKGAKVENFDKIQKALCKLLNGDTAASSKTSMLRVPTFKYYKKGETGTINPNRLFSCLKVYSEEEMTQALALEEPPLKPNRFTFKMYDFGSKNYGVWNQIDNWPVMDILEKLSGSSYVNGDQFTFKRINQNKFSVMVNSHPSPNWIDTTKNKIFSNNESKFCAIPHYLAWYGHSLADIKQLLIQLLNLQ